MPSRPGIKRNPRIVAVVRFVTLGLALLSLAAGAARAETPSTLDRVLAASLANHPSILGRRSAQAAAQADKEGAEWARYPAPAVEASSRGTNGNDPGGIFRIDQPLWAGGRITAGIDAAGSRFNAAGAALEETRLDLSLRVINVYLEALRQRGRETHAAAGVREHEKLLAMIGRRVEQEVSSVTDQRLAESRLYLARNELSIITQSRKNALTQLAQLSGQPVADISWQGLGEQGVPASLESALNSALSVSPILHRLTYEEEAAAADIDLKRSAYMPQVLFRLERSAGGGLAPDNRAMVVLTAQPGAGLAAAAGVDAAIARREAARLARDAAEREVRERVTLDWDELVAARSRLEAARLSSEMSGDVFDSYARQYVIGRKSWIDVLNAVREAIQAKFTLEDSRAQTMAAGMRLRAHTGTLKTQ